MESNGCELCYAPPVLSTHLLLVEDNPGAVRPAAELLEDARPGGFTVDRATSLESALEAASKNGYEVVLLDLSLPDSFGLDTLREFQAAHPELPVVVFSGHEDESTGIEAVNEGAQDFLVKGQGDGHLLARALRYAIERKKTSDRLESLAHFDALTGLPNRGLLLDRIDFALRRAQRNQLSLAVLFLDLDHFKDINDTLGHDAGDQLLRIVAERLRTSVRSSDTVARLGGDEFVILAEELRGRDDARAVADKVLEAMKPAVDLVGEEHFVGASLGIALFPGDAIDGEQLTKNADTALYAAKGERRGTYRFFEPGMLASSRKRVDLLNQLRGALDRQEFVVHYLPQFDIHSQRPVGMEALLRWQRADGTCVPASEFVAILEESGLVAAVDAWVVRQTCKESRAWLDRSDVWISVNVSQRTLEEARWSRFVAEALAESSLPPERLHLEILETAIQSGKENIVANLEALRELGVSLSVDNFGTGISSLQALHSSNVDAVKLDRAVVGALVGEDPVVAAAAIRLGQNLALRVVAKGVRGDDQLEHLRVHGCDEFQGFAWSAPIASDQVSAFLEERA